MMLKHKDHELNKGDGVYKYDNTKGGNEQFEKHHQ